MNSGTADFRRGDFWAELPPVLQDAVVDDLVHVQAEEDVGT